MKLGGPRRASVAYVAVTLVLGVLAFVVSSVVTSGTDPAFALSAGKGFAVTGTVDKTLAAGTCTGGPVKLFPGTPSCLLYSLRDALRVPITVTAVTATVVGFTPARTTPKRPPCKTSDVTIAAFTGSRVVPTEGTKTVGVRIELATDGTQDNCQGGTFHFVFHGTATYTDATTTTLTSTENPSKTGSPVTLIALVAPEDPTTDPFGPNGAGDHAVAFYSCSTPSCTARTHLATGTLAIATAAKKTASASYTTGALGHGTHYFEVLYRGTTTTTPDFSGSRAALAQRVLGS